MTEKTEDKTRVEGILRKVRGVFIQLAFDSDEAIKKPDDTAFLEMPSCFIERDSVSLGPYLKIITEEGIYAIKVERISSET